jgi:hypothetical protein
MEITTLSEICESIYRSFSKFEDIEDLVRNFIVDIMSYRMHVLSTVCRYHFLKYGPDISVFVVTFSN